MVAEVPCVAFASPVTRNRVALLGPDFRRGDMHCVAFLFVTPANAGAQECKWRNT